MDSAELATGSKEVRCGPLGKVSITSLTACFEDRLPVLNTEVSREKPHFLSRFKPRIRAERSERTVGAKFK